MSTTNLSTELSSTKSEHLDFQKVRDEKYCLKMLDTFRLMVYNNYISSESYENDGYEERISIIAKAKNKDILKFFEIHEDEYDDTFWSFDEDDLMNPDAGVMVQISEL